MLSVSGGAFLSRAETTEGMPAPPTAPRPDAARRTIRQNLAFSLAVIAVLVTVALTVGIPLPLGAVGREGSAAIGVLKGPRLLRSLD